MKKTISTICLFSLVLSLSAGTADSQAASKMKLSKTSVSVKAYKTVTVKTTVKYSKLKISVSKSGYVSVSTSGEKIKIKGLKPGSVKVTVKGYKSGVLKAKGTIKVKVKKAATVDVAGEYAPTAVHTGEGTFYDRTSTGAANLDDYEDTYLTAAMNIEDYMNGLAGAYIEVTDKDGDKVKVLITDMLPEGEKGDIDLSRKAFKKIEPEVTGRMKISWKVIALPTDDPVEFLWKPTSSQYWAQVQVRNHKYPIRSLEYYDSTTKSYKTLERESYNYFTAASGMGNADSYTFRVTDIYGRQIVEKNIKMKTNGKSVKGSQNFPEL